MESTTASGAVAATDRCPTGPPFDGGALYSARGDDDGVFGTLYNNTGSTIYAWGPDPIFSNLGGPCPVAAGGKVIFAASMDQPGFAYGPFRWAEDLPCTKEGGSYCILITTSQDWLGDAQAGSYPGVYVKLVDPYWAGRPSVTSQYREINGASCGSAASLDTGGLKEDQEYRLKGDEQGNILVKRFPDNKDIAREWLPGLSGVVGNWADDWARIDLVVESVGKCGR